MLLEAYSEFIKKAGNSVDDLRELWGKVGTCQRKLYRYLLQELLKKEAWDNDVNFKNEPSRGVLHGYGEGVFKFDHIGVDWSYALYKGNGHRRALVSSGGLPDTNASIDAKAFKRLFELRQAELGHMITALQSLETWLAFVSMDTSKDQGSCKIL